MNLSPPRTKSSPLYESYEDNNSDHLIINGGPRLSKGGDDDDDEELKEFLAEEGGDLSRGRRSKRGHRTTGSRSNSPSPKRFGSNTNHKCHYITVASITVNIILATTIIYVLSTSPSLKVSPFSSSINAEVVSSYDDESFSNTQHVQQLNNDDVLKNEHNSNVTTTSKEDVPNVIISTNNNSEYSHIALLGERNSGTTWTHAHLEECFSHTGIKVRNRLTRHKHWFQEDMVSLKQAALSDNDDYSINNGDKTLVIAQFRDPIYWVDAMRRKPHHSPMHYGYEKNQWREFLSIPWTLPIRPANDQRHVESFTLNHKASHDIFHPPCHEGFMPHQMMTCLRSPWAYVNEEVDHNNKNSSTTINGDLHGKINQTAYEEYFKEHQPLGKKSPKFSGYLPRYERHPITGEIYQNVLDLRRDKIYNFVQHVATWEWTSDTVRVERYEDLVANGTQSLIEYVEQETGLKANCTPYPPQPNRIVHNPWNNDDDAKEFLQYLYEHIDWEAEALIGYYQMTN